MSFKKQTSITLHSLQSSGLSNK